MQKASETIDDSSKISMIVAKHVEQMEITERNWRVMGNLSILSLILL